MAKTDAHEHDPTFVIADYDTSDDADRRDDPEFLEETHEVAERARAEAIERDKQAQIVAEQEELTAHYTKLIADAEHPVDIKNYFENSIDLDLRAGLITQEQYDALVARRKIRELYLKHLDTPSTYDGRYGD